MGETHLNKNPMDLNDANIQGNQSWITVSGYRLKAQDICKQKQSGKGAFALYQSIRQTHNINLSMQQIQHKAQLCSFWKGYGFFHGELYSVNDFDDQKYPFHEIKERENPTSDGHEELSKIKLKTFSKKKLAPKYEISFEKEFMKEHKAAFQKHYQNYIESIKQKRPLPKIQAIPTGLFKSQTNGTCQSALDVLKTELIDLTLEEKGQFIKDLQHEQKLREFLDFVVQSCSSSMAASFISVAQMLWMAYVPMQNQDLKVSKIVEFGKKVADVEVRATLDKHFKDFQPESKELDEDFFKLIEVFCTTALLTITGYFQNPYFAEEGQSNSFKRPWNYDISSDQDESFDSWQSIVTYKKRKSSA